MDFFRSFYSLLFAHSHVPLANHTTALFLFRAYVCRSSSRCSTCRTCGEANSPAPNGRSPVAEVMSRSHSLEDVLLFCLF
jgi:hypothetical protein